MPIRYRRTSVRTALGITTEEKRLKRALGITALLRPFRWWGNEKRDVKRDLGYYSPTAQLARHLLPHSLGKLVLIVLIVLGTPLAIGWWLGSAGTGNQQPKPAANSQSEPTTAGRTSGAARLTLPPHGDLSRVKTPILLLGNAPSARNANPGI